MIKVCWYFQTLLRYGANPDLRDEDGKTPLDKARERGDEGHREVIQILQSPGGLIYICAYISITNNGHFVLLKYTRSVL